MSAIKHMLDAKGTEIYYPAVVGAPNASQKVKEVRFDINTYPTLTFERDSTIKEMSLQIIVHQVDCSLDFQLSNNGTEFSLVTNDNLPLVFTEGVRANGHVEFANIGAKYVRLVFSVNSSQADSYVCVFTGD